MGGEWRVGKGRGVNGKKREKREEEDPKLLLSQGLSSELCYATESNADKRQHGAKTGIYRSPTSNSPLSPLTIAISTGAVRSSYTMLDSTDAGQVGLTIRGLSIDV